MREAKLVETGTIAPDAVDATGRIRAVSEAGVEAILSSYEDLGVIKDHVDLRRIKGKDKPRLLAGGHRLEACRRLGIEVPYKLWDCTNDWAELCELDDNLAGAELNALDTAVFLARRKRVYEKLHPDAKWGGSRGNQHTGGRQADSLSFCQTTAEKFGISRRKVERLVAAGSALGAAELQDLRRAPRPVTLADLQEIAKVGDVVERYDVCRFLGDGKAKSAKEARRAYRATKEGVETPVEAPKNEFYEKLNDLWKRAPKAVRARFASEHAEELSRLLGEPWA